MQDLLPRFITDKGTLSNDPSFEWPFGTCDLKAVVSDANNGATITAETSQISSTETKRIPFAAVFDPVRNMAIFKAIFYVVVSTRFLA